MSRILNSKKRFLLGVAASLVVAAAAFAYWTTSGGGTGTSTAGTDAGVDRLPVTRTTVSTRPVATPRTSNDDDHEQQRHSVAAR